MVEKTATINNPLGIHARPAALLVQTAAQFKADIYLSKGDVDGVNGKSIMGVMMPRPPSKVPKSPSGPRVRTQPRPSEAMVSLLESTFEGQT